MQDYSVNLYMLRDLIPEAVTEKINVPEEDKDLSNISLTYILPLAINSKILGIVDRTYLKVLEPNCRDKKAHILRCVQSETPFDVQDNVDLEYLGRAYLYIPKEYWKLEVDRQVKSNKIVLEPIDNIEDLYASPPVKAFDIFLTHFLHSLDTNRPSVTKLSVTSLKKEELHID